MPKKELIYNVEDANEILLEIYKNFYAKDSKWGHRPLNPNLYIEDAILKAKYTTSVKSQYPSTKDQEQATYQLNHTLDMLCQDGYIDFQKVTADCNIYCSTVFIGFTSKGHKYIAYLNKGKIGRFISDVSSDTWVQVLVPSSLAFILGLVTNDMGSFFQSCFNFIRGLF